MWSGMPMQYVFLDRDEAGRRLSKAIGERLGMNLLVAAIPRGGVPVAFQVAKRLRCEMDLVIPRKLPIPWNREAGFGAVTADGATVLNRSLVKAVGLHDDEVEAIAEEQRREVERLTEAYRRILPPVEMTGRPVAIIDDGLASGYTMLAAIESVRMRQPSEVIIASRWRQCRRPGWWKVWRTVSFPWRSARRCRSRSPISTSTGVI